MALTALLGSGGGGYMPLTSQERSEIKAQIISSWGNPDGTWSGTPISGGFPIGATKKPIQWFMSLPISYQRRIVEQVFLHMGREIIFNNRTNFVYFLPYHAVAGSRGRKPPLYSTATGKALWGGNNVLSMIFNDIVYKEWINAFAIDGTNAMEACQVIDNIFSWERSKQWFYGGHVIYDTNPPLELSQWVSLWNYQKTATFTGSTANDLHLFLQNLLPDIFCDVADSFEPTDVIQEREVSSVPDVVIFSLGKYEEGSKNYVMIKRDGNISNLLNLLQQKVNNRGKSVVFSALYNASSKNPIRERRYGAFSYGNRQYDLATYRWLVTQNTERLVHVYTLSNWLSYTQAVSILSAL